MYLKHYLLIQIRVLLTFMIGMLTKLMNA